MFSSYVTCMYNGSVGLRTHSVVRHAYIRREALKHDLYGISAALKNKQLVTRWQIANNKYYALYNIVY